MYEKTSYGINIIIYVSSELNTSSLKYLFERPITTQQMAFAFLIGSQTGEIELIRVHWKPQ